MQKRSAKRGKKRLARGKPSCRGGGGKEGRCLHQTRWERKEEKIQENCIQNSKSEKRRKMERKGESFGGAQKVETSSLEKKKGTIGFPILLKVRGDRESPEGGGEKGP